jgi:hypothetical protein
MRSLVDFNTGQPSTVHGKSTMSAADLELITLRAENKRLTELMKVKNQLLTSKNQVIACKDALIVQLEEESQQYTSPQPANLGSGWQRQHNSSNSSSSIEAAAEPPLDKLEDEMLNQSCTWAAVNISMLLLSTGVGGVDICSTVYRTAQPSTPRSL